MFDLAMTMAPASLILLTWYASLSDTNPARDSDPFALCRPIVSKLSLTITGMQWSDGISEFDGRPSFASASSRALGLVMTMALMAGPFLSKASMRRRYCSTSQRQVMRLAMIAAWICAMVASWTSNGGCVWADVI